MKKWWIIPASIIGYFFYKKYVLAKTFSVFFKNIDFSSMSFLSPTINIIVQINNPSDITATIQNIKGDLYLNNIFIGNVIGITPTILSLGSSNLKIPVTLSYSGVSELIKGMGTGGVNLKFEGSIMVDLITLPLNFEYHV
jgi:LEA14-like dessication related protein